MGKRQVKSESALKEIRLPEEGELFEVQLVALHLVEYGLEFRHGKHALAAE